MAYQQSDINNIVNGVLKYNGQRIAFPDGRYEGECTAPVVWYLTNMGAPVPAMVDNRADGWGVSFPAALAPYFTHEAFQSGKSYPYGTLLMWDSPHIAIVLHSDGSNHVQVFEQNADPNGTPCQVYNREVNNVYHKCTYALIPKVESPVPSATFQVIETYADGKQVKLNKQPTNLWGMNYHFDYMKDHPVEVHNQGEIWTVTNKVHHEDGYDYYRRDGQVDGFNVLDCDDYTPPPPVPYSPPAAPVPINVATTDISIVTVLMTFPSATDAQNHTKAQTTIPNGNYKIYKTAINGMLQIAKDNTGLKYWINPADNVVAAPAEPTPIKVTVTPEAAPASPTSWKASYKPLNKNNQPTKYKTTHYVVAHDFDGSAKYPDITIDGNAEVLIYGTFTYEGVLYGRPRLPADTEFKYFYGIPMRNPSTGQPTFKLPLDIEQMWEAITSTISELPFIITGKVERWKARKK